MSDSARKLTKAQRVLELVRLIERHGRLSKPEIDAKMSALSGETVEELKRNIYHDLKSLVSDGKLETAHYRKDGSVIENIEDEDPKYFETVWSLPGYGSRIQGQKLLENINCQALAAPRIARGVLVREGYTPGLGHNKVGLLLGGELLTIDVEEEHLPVRMLLSRKIDLETPDLAEKIAGIKRSRTILVLVPDVRLSSMDPISRNGHLEVEIEPKNKVTLKFLGSKNAPSVWVASPSEIQDFIKSQREQNRTLTMGIPKGEANRFTTIAQDEYSVAGAVIVRILDNLFLILGG